MILLFDVESTGLPNFNERARHPSQPHLVQVAAILCQNDGTEYESHNVIVKPDDWTIPTEASDIHGITTEIALRGIPEKLASELLLAMIKKTTNAIVAHNIAFDKFLARIAMRRYDLITDADDLWWKSLPTVCTMNLMTPVCQLPGKFAGKFKWPKLQEAYVHCFGKQFDGAHDALADVRACKEIYFWLMAKKYAVEADEVLM